MAQTYAHTPSTQASDSRGREMGSQGQELACAGQSGPRRRVTRRRGPDAQPPSATAASSPRVPAASNNVPATPPPPPAPSAPATRVASNTHARDTPAGQLFCTPLPARPVTSAPIAPQLPVGQSRQWSKRLLLPPQCARGVGGGQGETGALMPSQTARPLEGEKPHPKLAAAVTPRGGSFRTG